MIQFSLMSLVWDLLILNKTLISLIIFLSPISAQDCFDLEITEEDFPFSHLADLTIEDSDWNQSTFPYAGGGSHENGANGADFTYKLTLSEPAVIYVTTCDQLTNIDVQIGIYTEDCDSSSWIFFQDDSNSPIYYPDGTNESFSFECISGYVSQPFYANMLPKIEWDAGVYYIVVDDRGGTPGTGSVKTWMGYSLIVDSTTTSDDYSEINYHFSEGVYGGDYADVYNAGGIALDPEDYSLEINSNGGTADQADITSLSNLAGGLLAPGEENIKININYPDTPSGSEVVTVGPASVSSIFNSVGIPLLDVNGISIELIDALSPTINSSFPEDDQEGIEQNSSLTITFTEVVRASDNNNITDANASSCFKLKNMITDDVLPFTITTSDNITFTLNPNDNFPEYTFISLEVLSVIEDLNDNSFVSNTIQFRTEDLSPPLFVNESAVALTNEYVTITFSESVYSTDSGSGALELLDLSSSFSSNGGDCSNVSLNGLSNPQGNALIGGETTIRVLIVPESAPSGLETLSFSRANDNSIFDLAGNPMLSGSSPNVTLNVSAKINQISLADSNEYADIEFSVGVYGNSDLSIPLNMSSLGFDFIQNELDGGNTSNISITSLKNINNQNLTGGESIIRVYLTLDSLPSGDEEIIFYPNSNNSIYSLTGVPMPSGERDTTLLNDQLPITTSTSIDDGEINVNQGDPLIIEFDDVVYVPLGDSSRPATKEDLDQLITLRYGDDNGFDIPFFSVLDTINNTYTIYPLESYPSEETIFYSFNGELEDASGNEVDLNFNAVFTIQDYIPPQINSSSLALDDSYIDLFFDDNLYGDINSTVSIEIQDFIISLIPNDSDVDTVIITSITRTDSNFLIGGEDSIRLNLEYNASPTGNEIIAVSLSGIASMYDESGNQMEINTSLADGVILYDILPPSIINVSSSIDSFLVLMRTRPILFSFNEKITNLDFSVTAKHAQEVFFDSTKTDSSIEIILKPPFASFDSITVYFDTIQDISQLTTVDISFTYLTPMLGDYDLDTSLNYNDLWGFIQNWEDNNLNYELAPVTGDAPYFFSYPDSKFDIEDGMAFMRMWSWYQNTYGEIIEGIEEVGAPLQLISNGDELLILIEKQISAGQIQFSYGKTEAPPVSFLKRETKEKELFLNMHSNLKGFSTLDFARLGKNQIDTIRVSYHKNEQIQLSYSFLDYNRVATQKGTIQLNSPSLPTEFSLYPAFPNPFNPITTIRFDIPQTESSKFITIAIYDLQGRQVETLINGYMYPGEHNIQWQANQFSSGIYFIYFSYDNNIDTQKLILLK